MSVKDEKVVYTAVTGGKDSLHEDQIAQKDANYVAFVDFDTGSNVFERRKAWAEFEDPNRNAKIHKVMPHMFFPDAKYSLWIDGSIALRDDLNNMIEKYLDGYDLCVHKHLLRDCAYDEAMVCGSMGLDDIGTMSKQMARYFARDKYPQHNGLAECTVILRRHTPKIQEFNELWWNEISNGSRRDQLSFNYCCWKLGIKYNTFEGNVYQSPHFRYYAHKHYKKWGEQ